ncbi:unnamed protein product [Victoria cruziana]
MAEETVEVDTKSTEEWLGHANGLIPVALQKARAVRVFTGRWKIIISKLEKVPSCLSDLSSHPCFSKNILCREQLGAISGTLEEAVGLAKRCCEENYGGKLQMQSNLDALSAKLELNLRDCGLLVKTGVLGEATIPVVVTKSVTEGRVEAAKWNIKELLARLQIGHMEAKHQALDNLVEIIKEDEKSVLSVLGRSNVSAIVQLLSASPPRIKEKAALVVCSLAESGSPMAKEKAIISLQRLSMAVETARSVVGHGGVPPLIEMCQTGTSVSQSAAAGTLKNLSAVPEVRHILAEEGNMTCSNDSLRRKVISVGGLQRLLVYLDGPLPQESAVGAVRNLVGSLPVEDLIALGLLPRLVHVLKAGSLGAQQAAASAICRICNSMETRKLVGEIGCIPLLVKMLEAKTNIAREVAAQTIGNLLMFPQNCRDIRKDDKTVPNLVQLLGPSMQNTAKKYAISCLTALSSSKKCKKLMISYGAIGYLKKLCELDVPGAKKLLEKLERGKLRSFFSRK